MSEAEMFIVLHFDGKFPRDPIGFSYIGGRKKCLYGDANVNVYGASSERIACDKVNSFRRDSFYPIP